LFPRYLTKTGVYGAFCGKAAAFRPGFTSALRTQGDLCADFTA
jgi:hypothetical protein